MSKAHPDTTPRERRQTAGAARARRAGEREAAAPRHTAAPLLVQPAELARGAGDSPLLPPRWGLIAAAMLAMLVAGAIATRTLPPAVAALMAAGAAVAIGAYPLLAWLDRVRAIPEKLCFAAMLVAVGAPLALVGAAGMVWARAPRGLGLEGAGAMLAATALFATILLERRRGAVLTAHGGLWVGIALVDGSAAAIAMLLLGLAAASALAARQARASVVEAERQASTTLRQQRADAIITELEQSGQSWFWETDRRGMLTYVSPPIAELLRGRRRGLVGRPITALFDLSARADGPERTLTFHLSARSAFQDLPVRAAMQGDGEARWWSITARPMHDAFGNFQGFRGAGSDLTERRKSQQHISRLARSDALTGLANRTQMAEALERILAAPRDEQRACAVFLLDLDRFKQVNDTLGHPAGDALLKHVSQRLERSVDKASRVGRLGGDEFQVILPGVIARDDLSQLAERIIDTLTQPYAIDGQRVAIGASIGIAIAPDDGGTSDELIRNADLALYAAKDRGRGRHHFYSRDLHSEAERRRQLEHDLRDALASGGLALRYQPVVDTTTERVTGFEALLYWRHPVLGPLSPALFVPIAEETGLIEPIGEWALRTACADLAKWPAPLRVAVNVSPRQFVNPAFSAIVTSALAAAQIPAARLELEITESVFLGDTGAVESMFAALKRLDVRLALDDFGTGYSSLSYLQKYPFDKIKIDRAFVHGATAPGNRNQAIIAAIVSLAAALGMETTAEGVETLDELELIRELGCSHIQGFIYQRPISAADATALLAATPALVARGPRSSRAERQTTLRRVDLEYGARRYEAVIRNMSDSGALIESDWAPPPGTAFRILAVGGEPIDAIASWTREGRIGATFADAPPPALPAPRPERIETTA